MIYAAIILGGTAAFLASFAFGRHLRARVHTSPFARVDDIRTRNSALVWALVFAICAGLSLAFEAVSRG